MGIPEPDPNFATRTRPDPNKYGSGMGMHNMGRVKNGLTRVFTIHFVCIWKFGSGSGLTNSGRPKFGSGSGRPEFVRVGFGFP